MMLVVLLAGDEELSVEGGLASILILVGSGCNRFQMLAPATIILKTKK